MGGAQLEELLGIRFHGFTDIGCGDGETISLGDITVSEDAIVRRELQGHPLVVEHTLGKGTVVFVNAKGYPADPNVRAVYEPLLHHLGRLSVENQNLRGFMTTSDTVEMGVYDRDDSLRDIYAVNINWWAKENQPALAVLHFAGEEYSVMLDRDVMHIFTLAQTLGIWTSDFDTDVISIQEETEGALVTLQGYGKTKIRLIGSEDWETEDMMVTKGRDGIREGELVLNGCRTLHLHRIKRLNKINKR